MTKTSNPDIFRPLDVPESLKPFIRRALIADTHEPVDMLVDVRATGYHYFGWVWRGRWQGVVDGETCFDSEVDGPLTMTGQVGNAEIFAKMQRDIGQIFLEFSALGHFQLLGITGAQLLENAKAPHILNPALKPEMQKIMGAKDMATSTRIDVLADVLSQLPIHAVPDGMENAVKRMEAADGDIRLAELLAELGLAERQFRTEFKRIIGLTPKAFCKTLQINRALNHLLTSTKGDLASVAIETGFSDQAHFTRAFSKFLGKAPKGYLVDVEKTLSRFVGQSRPG